MDVYCLCKCQAANGQEVFWSVVRRRLRVDQLHELDPLLMSMPGHARADHLAVERAQRREQRRRPVANVVMRHRRGLSLAQRQAGLRAIQHRPAKLRDRPRRSAIMNSSFHRAMHETVPVANWERQRLFAA